MKSFLRCAIVAGLLLGGWVAPAAQAQYPTPSLYPISWEIRFEPGKLQRIVVQPAGTNTPKAYWYLPYRVTNLGQREQPFLPYFELLTEDGQLIRSDRNVPPSVYQAIRARERNQFLQPYYEVAGLLRVGPEQAKDSVAIWEEPAAEMGHFSIFVGGLSGETAEVPGPGDEKVTLRKTLQLNYHIRGDEVFPGEDPVGTEPQVWIMR